MGPKSKFVLKADVIIKAGTELTEANDAYGASVSISDGVSATISVSAASAEAVSANVDEQEIPDETALAD